jgi:bifunctional non-homologous end joining protein LigD
MLATTFEGTLEAVDEAASIAEPKDDGTRLLLEKFDGEVSLYTRRHVERSETLRELTEAATATLPDGFIVDDEHTVFTPDGQSRLTPIHAGQPALVEKAVEGTYFVFDILGVDGEWCLRRSLQQGRALLEQAVSPETPIVLTESRESGFRAFFGELVDNGEEEIILKQQSSQYHIGTRTTHWQKVKAFTESDVQIVGYTPGDGRRAGTFGALMMMDAEGYVGRVGSGLTDAELESILEVMTPTTGRPVSPELVGKPYTPVEPFVVEVEYQAVTESGELRAPVFVRLRPDKPVEDVTEITT